MQIISWLTLHIAAIQLVVIYNFTFLHFENIVKWHLEN